MQASARSDWRTHRDSLRRSRLHREAAAEAIAEQGIQLTVVKLPEAKHGFVLLPKRWVVEHSFACTSRFRRLARDYKRLAETVVELHFVAFAILMLSKLVQLAIQNA